MKRLDPEFYHRMVDESLIGLLAFAEESGCCVFANPVAMNLLEWTSQDDLERKFINDLVPKKAEKRITCFNSSLLLHEGLYQEVLIQKEGGSFLISNLGVKHFSTVEGRFILLMVQDITLQKKLQREITGKQTEIHRALQDLKKQNRQLRELDLAKNRFIALTTHELRTPLSAMVASAEVLQLGLYDTPEQLSQFVNLIVDQGQHLTRLVNDILDFTKIQAGKMDYYIENQNVVETVMGRGESFKNMAQTALVELTFEVEKGKKIEAFYDTLRLQQVLDNMINNAIKYNKPQGKVIVRVIDSSTYVRVEVEDTGRGIEAENIEKVFDEFETLGQVALHHQGTGLGMPISKKMMEAMGGTMHVNSTVGKGSRFWIEIPKTKVLDESFYRTRMQNAA